MWNVRIGRKRKDIPKQAIPPAQHAKNPRNLNGKYFSSQARQLFLLYEAHRSHRCSATQHSAHGWGLHRESDRAYTYRQCEICFLLLTSPLTSQGNIPAHTVPDPTQGIGGRWRRLRVVLHGICPSEPRELGPKALLSRGRHRLSSQR